MNDTRARIEVAIESVGELPDYSIIGGERVPIGVTGHIVPWNVPIHMVASGIGREKGLADLAAYSEIKSITVTL